MNIALAIMQNTCSMQCKPSGWLLCNPHLTCAWCAQFDGGRTYTEPCCIMTGRPENMAEVSPTPPGTLELAACCTAPTMPINPVLPLTYMSLCDSWELRGS